MKDDFHETGPRSERWMQNQGKHDQIAEEVIALTDPETKIKPIAAWGPECYRGFVRDSRFGPGQVVKGTNRSKSRENHKLLTWENAR